VKLFDQIELNGKPALVIFVDQPPHYRVMRGEPKTRPDPHFALALQGKAIYYVPLD